MTNLEIAREFIRCFCAGDVDCLEPLLAEDLRFEGPFHRFQSRADYLRTLRDDPPVPSEYEILSIAESDKTVSIFWEYNKRDGTTTIAQLFSFKNGVISEILLVFDGR